MQKYTLGFIFNKNLDHVLLMHKNRPDWQAGKVNGLGGKLFDGEDSIDCIAREIKEESNLDIQKERFVYIGNLSSDTFHMDVFGAVYDGSLADAQSMETEEVEWFQIESLPKNGIDKLSWLIHITLDKIKNNKIDNFEVKYFDDHRK